MIYEVGLITCRPAYNSSNFWSGSLHLHDKSSCFILWQNISLRWLSWTLMFKHCIYYICISHMGQFTGKIWLFVEEQGIHSVTSKTLLSTTSIKDNWLTLIILLDIIVRDMIATFARILSPIYLIKCELKCYQRVIELWSCRVMKGRNRHTGQSCPGQFLEPPYPNSIY